MMSSIAVFITAAIAFSGYLVGKTRGYADFISLEEKKKGCQQFSRQPFNQRF